MKAPLLLVAAVVLTACSRNPDPEYAPDQDEAPVAASEVTVETTVEAPAAATRLSEEETMRLGREAATLLFAQDIATLWPRFDANVQAQAQSQENFGDMVAQIFGQIGAEMTLVEEAVETNPEHAALSIYRRRGNYLAIGQDANLLIVFNADGTIAGLNFQPAE